MDVALSLEKDHQLIEAIRDNRTSLFLGAGASFGAIDNQQPSKKIPDSDELANLLSRRFLFGKLDNQDFRYVYDLCCSKEGVRAVQRYIHDILIPFGPSQDHLLIPTFAWAAIFTTNYDLVVERAYEQQRRKLQQLRVLSWDPDDGIGPVPESELLYLKLHGSITAFEHTDPPLIASTDQLIDFRSKRKGMFDTFLEHAKLRTMIFVGYSFKDTNLRNILAEVIKDGDNHPPHYTVLPHLNDYEADYWSERRIRPIRASFGEFLQHIDKVIPEGERKLGILAATLKHTEFSRFITRSGQTESSSLARYFNSSCQIVSKNIDAATATDPREFYKGRSEGWGFITTHLDVIRSLTTVLMRDEILAPNDSGQPRLIVLKSYAGGGRTVFLKRLAWETAITNDKPVLYIDPNGKIDLNMFEEIFSLTNLPIYLFVDDVSRHIGPLKSLIKRAKQGAWKLSVIGTERFNEWNINCSDELDSYVSTEYNLGRLTDIETQELLAKLEIADCLGELGGLTFAERFQRFKDVYDRQILVALYEATRGWDFQRIVTDEYDKVVPRRAQLLYLDVCSLHRFGVPARAGLISRVHDLTFAQFKDDFFKPLEQVVYVSHDGKSGDYIYTSRHRLIAEMVYNSQVTTLDDKFDNISRIVSKLNSTYSYDMEVIGLILRAPNLIELGFGTETGSALYDLAITSFGSFGFLYHQWAIFLMSTAETAGQLDRAEDVLATALHVEERNAAFRHTAAEIALRRSRFAVSLDERAAWRNRAISIAQKLTKNSRTPHPFHTIAKARIDALAECIAQLDAHHSGYDTIFDEEVKEADKAIREGLDRFPNDPHLLTSLSEYYVLLAKSDKALTSLEAAFNGKPQSVFVARRLASAYEARNELKKARDVLVRCLDYNPGNVDIHYEIAKNYLSSQDYVDDSSARDIILHHLVRSVQKGDKRYDRRFWYARELFLHGHGGEAKSIFDDLRNAPIPFHLKAKPRGEVRVSDGSLQRYSGRVRKVWATYCFIQTGELPRDIYAFTDDFPASTVVEGMRVAFCLTFTMFGPLAFNIELLL
jgi:tetratricopeptide (TPR) repeat protein